MKPYCLLLLFFILANTSRAAFKPVTDTPNHNTPVVKSIEQMPAYPGGVTEFYKYIAKKVKYPDVARLIGIDGKVVVSFVVEKDGRINQVTPVQCLGAGCDAAAVEVIQQSKPWIPGVQDGKPVRVQFSVPINFSIKNDNGIVSTRDLRRSDYGFIFQIKGNIYTLDEAEAMLGKRIATYQIAEAVPYEGTENYQMPDKKAVYIIVMKS